MDKRSTIKTLLLISGPSGVGKTTILDSLKNGESSPLTIALGFDLEKEWEFLIPLELKNIAKINAKRVVLHYDHNRITNLKPPCIHFGDDHVFRILDRVENLIFVTMWEPPEVLIQRCSERIQNLPRRLYNTKRVRKVWFRFLRMRKALALYAKPQALWTQYLEWFHFCSQLKLTSHILFRGSTMEIKDASDCLLDRPVWETNEPQHENSSLQLLDKS